MLPPEITLQDLRNLLQTARIKTIQSLYPTLTNEDFMSAENLSEEIASSSVEPAEVAETPSMMRAKPLLALGLKIVPIQTGKKACVMADWPELATNDETLVRQWATKNPNGNWGVVAEAKKGGFAAFDADQAATVHDKILKDTGHDIYKENFFMVKSSPKDKGHFYFLHTERSASVENSFLRPLGEDGQEHEVFSWRADRQYVVGMGSVKNEDGREFVYCKLSNSCDTIPEIPDWFVDWIIANATNKKATPSKREPDSGFKKLADAVGFESLRGRLRKESDFAALQRGENILCPLPKHRSDSKPSFGACKGKDDSDLLHCFGCEFTGDVIKTVHTIDEKYSSMYDTAKVICAEQGLSYEDFFPKTAPADETLGEPLLDDGSLKSRIDAVLRENLRRNRQEWSQPRIVVANAIGELRLLETADPSFPSCLTEKSLWGIFGDFVKIALPTTEASAETLLYTLLPVLGTYQGKLFYSAFGADKHYPVTFTLTSVGTAGGKGQALHAMTAAIKSFDPEWAKRSIKSHAASGESLPRLCFSALENVTTRIALVPPEMATILIASARDNSILGQMLRMAYDFDTLENPRSDAKKSPTATNYTLGVAGFITPGELREKLPHTDWVNGSINRFLWNVGQKSKNLKTSRSVPDFTEWGKRVSKLVVFGQPPQRIDYSPEGLEVWNNWVDGIPEDDGTKFASAMGREKPNCLRIAALYATYDERRLEGWKPALEPRHVEAAIEIVAHSRESVGWHLFGPQGESMKNMDESDLRKVRELLAAKGAQGAPLEVTQTEIRDLLGHDKSWDEKSAICLAVGLRLADRKATNGRSVRVWVSV